MTQETLNNLFVFIDGKLYWRKNLKLAGYILKDKRRIITIKKKGYYSYNIIWKMFKGEIPFGYKIIHLDRNKLNDNINNLALVEYNPKVKRKASGVVGVYWSEIRQKWYVINYNRGKQKYVGSFDNLDEAIAIKKEI